MFEAIKSKFYNIKYKINRYKNNLIKKLYIKNCKEDIFKKVPEWTNGYSIGDDYYSFERSIKINYANFIHLKAIYVAIEEIYDDDTSICGVLYNNDNGKISVEISTKRPGLIIGKGGRDIDKLNAKLNEYFGTKVEIKLKEIK